MVALAALACLPSLPACGSDMPVQPSDPDVVLDTVVTGLDAPVLAVSPPGDTARLFVVEQTGDIRIVRRYTVGGEVRDSIYTTPFLSVRTLISCCGERGLLGLAFHPQYAANGFLYINYTDAAGDTRVVRYRVSANPDRADAASASLVLAQPQPFANHNGGMLAFGPDGYLYIGLGDGGSGGDPQGNGQDLTTLLGKILRIDVDGGAPYAIPPGNPYAGSTTARREIWASGLRNPWRFSFDRLTGDLYIGDVGQNAREEIDVQSAASAGGENYGWNIMEGTGCFQPGCTPLGLTPPVLDYPNPGDGCSVTGGYVYRGNALPALRGTYFYGDFCSGWVRSFRWVAGAIGDQRDWTALRHGGNISGFGEDGRGELYVMKYADFQGMVFRLAAAN